MKNKLVLVIDDMVENSKLIKSILALQNIDVIYATESEAGIKLALEQTPDLILQDIMMPDIDGIETCLKLKSIEKTKYIPIIFLTAAADIETIERALNSGGNDYITKPFIPLTLIARITTQFRIIDQQKELNKQLIDSLADDKEKALSKLTGTVAHELNNVLHAILGYTNFLKRDLNLSVIQKKSIDAISTSGEKGSKIVSELLNFYQNDNSTLMNDIDFRELCYNFNNTVTNLICKDKNMDIVCTEDEVSVKIQKSQIIQIISKLFTYFAYITKSGATISARITRNQLDNVSSSVYSSKKYNGNFLCFTIKTSQDQIVKNDENFDEDMIHRVLDLHSGFMEKVSSPEYLSIKMYIPLTS